MKTKREIEERYNELVANPKHDRESECSCCRWIHHWADALRWVLDKGENKELMDDDKV